MLTRYAAAQDEMVFEFLKMELSSARFRDDLLRALAVCGAGEELILRGDPADPAEILLRREVLGEFRGYGRDDGVFKRFPAEIRWERVFLTPDDLPKIRYINYSYWNELSLYTGNPLDAADTVRSGREIFGVSNSGFLATARALENGARFPPLILLTDPDARTLFLFEGHHRITAYCLVPHLFREVDALVGFTDSAALMRWHESE